MGSAVRLGLVATLVAGAAIALPSVATATPSVLFSQSGGVATARQVAPKTFDVTLRTAHRAVLAFEDRPGRRTATLPEHKFVGLWRVTFRTDPPNAVLTGRDPQGRNRRVVVTISRAARTPDGVRYRMRALRGVMPGQLAMANLLVDDVPMSAITAYLQQQGGGVAQYEALINALRFPMVVQPTAAPTLSVPPGSTVTLGEAAAPGIITLGSLTVASGATLVLQGVINVNAQSVTLGPGARIVMPTSPSVLSLTAAGLPVCAPPDDLAFQGTLTQVRSLLNAVKGMSVTQPAPRPWPVSTVSAAGSGGMCVLNWGFSAPTVVASVPVPWPSGPNASPGMATMVTQSSTQEVVTVGDAGPLALSNVVLTVRSWGVNSSPY